MYCTVCICAGWCQDAKQCNGWYTMQGRLTHPVEVVRGSGVPAGSLLHACCMPPVSCLVICTMPCTAGPCCVPHQFTLAQLTPAMLCALTPLPCLHVRSICNKTDWVIKHQRSGNRSIWFRQVIDCAKSAFHACTPETSCAHWCSAGECWCTAGRELGKAAVNRIAVR